MTICNHELIDYEDRTGNHLRNLILAGTFSIDYRIWDDLTLAVGVEHSFSDYHSYGEISPVQQLFFTSSPSIKMREAFIRVRQMF